MAPKFRGDSEDWLDDEDSRASPRGPGAAKRPPARADALPPAQGNAVVAEVFPKQCAVWPDPVTDPAPGNASEAAAAARFLASYRWAGVVGGGGAELRERSPVAVGDRVKVSRVGADHGVVEGICRRRNSLARPAPGRATGIEAAGEASLQHVIAANVDILVVVASTQHPEFSPGLVDRYLVAAHAAGIAPVMCITKADLAPGPGAGARHSPGDLYRRLGYPVFDVSVQPHPESAAALRAAIMGRVAVFCGKSGVGKTSLLNALLGWSAGRVGEVSEMTRKGKHTTSSAVLLGGPGDSRWIDTPGVREFGLHQVAPRDLASHFPELRLLACPQAGCLHLDEPGCLARGQPRYASYRRILQSLLAGEH